MMLNIFQKSRTKILLANISITAALLLTGCLPGGRAQTKIPFEKIEAVHQDSKKILVVVLPGRGDDVANLKASAIAQSIQSAMPEADVVLTGVSMAYYMEGRMPQRLHEEIMLPAIKSGYTEIWLTGASMGGMGALMYDREYPSETTGLVLLAPYLGSKKTLQAIESSGGLQGWDAGPLPARVDKNNFEQELWRYLKTWQHDNTARSHDVWLAYGDDDQLRAAMPPLQKLLPVNHVFVRDGGHAWVVWSPAAKEIFAAIAKERTNK